MATDSSEQLSPNSLRPLLDYLAQDGTKKRGDWREWRIRPVAGGYCNLLYRVTGPGGDLAVKFTIRDQRQRARREYLALTAVRQAGSATAPHPIYWDQDSYAQPVVVQTWLEGEVSATPPATDEAWQKLLRQMAAIHAITPSCVQVELHEIVGGMVRTAEQAREAVRQQAARIPHQEQPHALQEILSICEASQFPQWPETPVSLCQHDNNILNFIRRPGAWASVDWENSGWGDPAYDVAHLMTHIAYADVDMPRWNWVTHYYASLVEDETVVTRIQTYHKILLVWWVARLARYLYEIPRGLDPRLAPWPDDWQTGIRAQLERYHALAQELLTPSVYS